MKHSFWLRSAAFAAYVFLYAPLLIVVVYSFNDSSMNAQWVGFTLKWYDKLFHNTQMLAAAWNSLVIALTDEVAKLGGDPIRVRTEAMRRVDKERGEK